MLSIPIWLVALVIAALAPLVVGAFVAGLEKRVQRRTLRVLVCAQIAPLDSKCPTPPERKCPTPPERGRN
jgi:hypothetical protein